MKKLKLMPAITECLGGNTRKPTLPQAVQHIALQYGWKTSTYWRLTEVVTMDVAGDKHDIVLHHTNMAQQVDEMEDGSRVIQIILPPANPPRPEMRSKLGW